MPASFWIYMAVMIPLNGMCVFLLLEALDWWIERRKARKQAVCEAE